MKKDNPGIFIPPPLIYISIFLLSILLQKFIPLPNSFFETAVAKVLGWLFIMGILVSALPAAISFLKAKTSIITIRPASSLQTTGIYSVSRNPMYLGLSAGYTGIAFLAGNWWTLILIPVAIFIISKYVIKREEEYLERAFGQKYIDYKMKVRRWI